MVLTLRSPRAHEGLYHADERFREIVRLGAADPHVFVRRFEVAVYCVMCLGTALVLLGLLVAAT